MIPIEKKLLFSFILIIILSGCGSDVDPGTIEGPPRSSEAIYKQDPAAEAPQPDPSGEEPSSDTKDEKVVDAEFEEVDEDKKD